MERFHGVRVGKTRKMQSCTNLIFSLMILKQTLCPRSCRKSWHTAHANLGSVSGLFRCRSCSKRFGPKVSNNVHETEVLCQDRSDSIGVSQTTYVCTKYFRKRVFALRSIEKCSTQHTQSKRPKIWVWNDGRYIGDWYWYMLANVLSASLLLFAVRCLKKVEEEEEEVEVKKLF